MNVYTFDYDGWPLGGICIVIAESEEEARAIAEKEAGKPVRLESDQWTPNPRPVVSGMVVHNWDGNY